MQTVNKLSLVQPTHEYAANTCGPYYFLVRQNNMAHVAFSSQAAFMRWLKERGLKLSRPLVSKGKFSYQDIIGEFHTDMMINIEAFRNMAADYESRRLSNGDYTLAKFKINGNIVTEYYLNVNCKKRITFDYKESWARYN